MTEHIVKLDFFQDDANGEWGVAHSNSLNVETPFNAFWNGLGLFHDVFEHWFEDNHKYFKGDYAFNVGGEIAAMGGMTYYVYEMGFRKRLETTSSYSAGWTSIINQTLSDIQESMNYGYTYYGRTLECRVPQQKDTGYTSESILEEYIHRLKEAKNERRYLEIDYEDEKQDAITYRNSVKCWKVRNLHRYGYNLAEKLVPPTQGNLEMLTDYWNFMDKFCLRHSAEDLANIFRSLEVRVYGDKSSLEWDATLIGKYPYPDISIKEFEEDTYFEENNF